LIFIYRKVMSKYLYPIDFTKEIIKESRYTALINYILPELEKTLAWEIINRKRPKDLRAKPELLQTLSLRRWRKVYLDGSPKTHKQEYNSQYANDFLVAIGTPIQAIADWRVISKQDGFDEYGIEEKYGDKCNYITIAHDDNKISQYIHLEKFSLTNTDKVKRGQTIWYTWASWRMDLPHLHFAFYQDEVESMSWRHIRKNIPLFYPNSNSKIKDIIID